MPDTSGGTEGNLKKPRRGLRRIIGFSLIAILAAAGVIGFYTWQLGAEARAVYKLGSTLNTFFKDYSSAIKRKNLEELLGHYHEDYASGSEGIWEEKLFWEDTRSGDDGVRVYFWEQRDPRPFTR